MEIKRMAAIITMFMSANAMADNEVKVNGDQNSTTVYPTFCLITTSSKIKSCNITVGGSQGAIVTTEFKQQKPLQEYMEDPNPSSSNYSDSDNFSVTPKVTGFKNDGKKQVRLTYVGDITPEMKNGEIYGRLVITAKKAGSLGWAYNLPVYFSTDESQAPKVSHAAFGNRTVELMNGKGEKITKTMPTLTVTNDGNGILAVGQVSFTASKNASQNDLVKEFHPFNMNVAPHSKDTAIIFDDSLAKSFEAARGKNVVFYIKKDSSFMEVSIDK